MDHPIPTHLKNIFKVNENKTDGSDLNGDIVCECGCEHFSVLHNEDRKYDEALSYDEQYGLKVVAICNNCGRKHLIFDEASQGYSGFVCGEFRTAPDDSLTELVCSKCGTAVFSLTLDIETEDKEQFIEECVNEYPDRFSPDDHIDAFDWITITVCCQNCALKDEWISLELS